jgi:RNA polymerase sigma-70 factor (ECF subfamily)
MDAVEVGRGWWVLAEVDQTNLKFEVVYEAEHNRLLRIAYALTGHWAAAEDLTQEAFLRLQQQWRRVSAYERPEAWLRRVLLNLATSRARRLAAEARAAARFARERSTNPTVSEDTAEFWGAIRALPRRQAQVLALFYAEDRAIAEVAEILGCAEGTVRAHLHQGRETLRRRLALDEEDA